ncbi:hypothetical protein [Clostridium sp. BJN0013]|uniref:hypothetical protein n=1 Tax=Clostridium sp. BJN0013 TaxID=3236840 RepID=UPI0034C6BA0A
MKDFIKHIPIFLGLWLGLSIICTVIFCVIVNKLKKKHDRTDDELNERRKEFKGRWNKHGR